MNTSTGISYFSALGTFLEHPIDSISSVLTPAIPEKGISFDGGFADVAVPSDSISSAAVRAAGIDPVTGIASPAYIATLQSNGFDPQNPQPYIQQLQAAALQSYNSDLAKSLNANDAADSIKFPDLPGLPGSGAFLPLVAVFLVLILVISAVK